MEEIEVNFELCNTISASLRDSNNRVSVAFKGTLGSGRSIHVPEGFRWGGLASTHNPNLIGVNSKKVILVACRTRMKKIYKKNQRLSQRLRIYHRVCSPTL